MYENIYEAFELLHFIVTLPLYSRYYRIVEKQRLLDEKEMEVLHKNKEKYLLQAVENYLQCLIRGDKYNVRVFRLTSLWFNNVAIQEVNNLMKVRFDINLFNI